MIYILSWPPRLHDVMLSSLSVSTLNISVWISHFYNSYSSGLSVFPGMHYNTTVICVCGLCIIKPFYCHLWNAIVDVCLYFLCKKSLCSQLQYRILLMQPTCALDPFSKFICMPTSICISGCIKNSYFHNGIMERDGGPFTTFSLVVTTAISRYKSADCQHQSNWDIFSSE